MDNNALLWREVVLESRLSLAGALDFSAEAEGVEFEELENLVCLCGCGLLALDHKESWFEAVAED